MKANRPAEISGRDKRHHAPGLRKATIKSRLKGHTLAEQEATKCR